MSRIHRCKQWRRRIRIEFPCFASTTHRRDLSIDRGGVFVTSAAGGSRGKGGRGVQPRVTRPVHHSGCVCHSSRWRHPGEDGLFGVRLLNIQRCWLYSVASWMSRARTYGDFPRQPLSFPAALPFPATQRLPRQNLSRPLTRNAAARKAARPSQEVRLRQAIRRRF